MKIKRTDEEIINNFWESHPEALFNEKEIALVRRVSVSKVAHDRVDKEGPKFIKVMGTVLYRKRDVEEYLKGLEK